jgi:hypothetical protein
VDEDRTKDHESYHGLDQGGEAFRLVGWRVLRPREDFGGKCGCKDGTCVKSREQWGNSKEPTRLTDAHRTKMSTKQCLAETFDIWNPLE